MYEIVKEIRTYNGILTTAEYRILALLADYADIEGEACPSARTLAKCSGYSERTVFKALAHFRELGIIDTLDQNPEKFRGYKSATRRFSMPDAWFEPATPARQRRQTAEILAPTTAPSATVETEEVPAETLSSYKPSSSLVELVKTSKPHFVRFCAKGDKMSHTRQDEAEDPAKGLWDDVEPVVTAKPASRRGTAGAGWEGVRVAVAHSRKTPAPAFRTEPQRLVGEFIDLAKIYEDGPPQVNAGALGRTFKLWLDEHNMTYTDISEMIRIFFQGGYRRKGILWKDFLDMRMDLWKHHKGNLERAAKPVYDDMNDDDGSVLIDWDS